MPNSNQSTSAVDAAPPVSSFVYQDWNVTIRAMDDDEPETYFEWYLEKKGSNFRDPTTHRSIQAAEKFAKDAVDSIIQDENDRIRRRRKKK